MGEKITDERIVEYIWLHADEPSEKIQAGILKEFGVERSLDWVTKERVDYLNADKPYTEEENITSSPSVDEDVIQRIAKAFPSVNVKQILEIMRLKATTRLGYRKIGQKLNPAVGKDTVMGILKMNQSIAKPQTLPLKSPEVAKEEARYERIKVLVAEKEYIKCLRKKTEELHRRDVHLSLENDGDDLIVSIAESEMAKIHPETHQLFRQYCERQRLSVAAALQEMGLTATGLIDSFDDWYEQQAKDGDIGIKALSLTVTLKVNAFLHKQSKSLKKK